MNFARVWAPTGRFSRTPGVNCRRILTRAAGCATRFTVSRRESEEIVRRFRHACVTRRRAAPPSAPRRCARLVSDGGGKGRIRSRERLEDISRRPWRLLSTGTSIASPIQCANTTALFASPEPMSQQSVAVIKRTHTIPMLSAACCGCDANAAQRGARRWNRLRPTGPTS